MRNYFLFNLLKFSLSLNEILNVLGEELYAINMC